MSLQKEIDINSKRIHSDGYSMSIGEIISLYKDDELDLHPEFQRIFRWNIIQKSKLIESILLGIPIPSIFVSQRDDGVWDVIDGLQRLSSILEFVGELRDENNIKLPPSVLIKTKYLPSLEGKYWNKEGDKNNSLTQAQRIFIKRAKLDIKIIKKESDPEAKYELFQRLNTLGSHLSDQEIRNYLLVMINPEFYKELVALANIDAFLETIPFTERNINEQYNVEIALRFIIYLHTSVPEIKKMRDVSEFVTEKMLEIARNSGYNYKNDFNVFTKTFKVLNLVLADNSFKKYYTKENQFKGAFSISAFETIAIGIASYIDSYYNKPDTYNTIAEIIKSIWSNKTFRSHSGSGLRAANRLPYLLPLGKKLFKNED